MRTGPGFESLRRGRASQEGARYFLTLATHGRCFGLTTSAVADALHAEITQLRQDASWREHASVIMPDHAHILITLGDRLTIGQCVGRLKAKTRSALASVGVRWQPNYFEHRLRADEPLESVIRYLFLNPYRANLCTADQRYKWFWLGEEEATWFHASPSHPLPEIEWIR